MDERPIKYPYAAGHQIFVEYYMRGTLFSRIIVSHSYTGLQGHTGILSFRCQIKEPGKTRPSREDGFDGYDGLIRLSESKGDIHETGDISESIKLVFLVYSLIFG